MSPTLLETCPAMARDNVSPLDARHAAQLSTVADILPLLDGLGEAMVALGYPERDVFCVRLALEEALVNAIKHGHHYDPSKRVEVNYQVSREYVLVEIEDQGEGFDHFDVPDPTARENLERPCGRGLLLMRSYMSSIRYSDRGTSVTLCKYPSRLLAPA